MAKSPQNYGLRIGTSFCKPNFCEVCGTQITQNKLQNISLPIILLVPTAIFCLPGASQFYPTVTTNFPAARLSSINLCASAISSNRNTFDGFAL